MTKKEIAAALCERIPELQKAVALRTVEGVTEIIAGALANGESVHFRGFGALEPKMVKEKKARNINTGDVITVPATRTVRFRIYTQLKNRINNGTVD
jgi:DNA-binding protein HU-beta